MSTEIGNRLRALREASGYSTARAAAQALGVHYQTYVGHENSSRGITPSSLLLYARRYKVTVDWLMTGRGDARGNQPEPGRISDETLRLVLIHLAEHRPNLINADPQGFANLIVDLCDYAQATQRLETPELDLALKLVGINEHNTGRH